MTSKERLSAEYVCVGTFTYGVPGGIRTVDGCRRPATEIVEGETFCRQCAERRRGQISWAGDLLAAARNDGVEEGQK